MIKHEWQKEEQITTVAVKFLYGFLWTLSLWVSFALELLVKIPYFLAIFRRCYSNFYPNQIKFYSNVIRLDLKAPNHLTRKLEASFETKLIILGSNWVSWQFKLGSICSKSLKMSMAVFKSIMNTRFYLVSHCSRYRSGHPTFLLIKFFESDEWRWTLVSDL